MRLSAAACIVALASAGSAWPSAEPIRTLDAAAIQQAIKAGDIIKQYRLRATAVMVGYFSTPFARVAFAAADAKRRYQPFTEKDVTPEMIAPEVWVYAFPYSASRGDIRSVEAVVLVPDTKDRSTVVQPMRTEPLNSSYQNLFGAKFEGRGVLAVFPLDAFTDRSEVRIVWDIKWNCGGLRGSDCGAKVDLSDVR